jgi:ABC-type polysaccharide/polyol phosphate transport system ATPase subunit
VLAVGDQAFAARGLEKIRAFQAAGKTIMVASHSAELTKSRCQRAMWMDRGRVIQIGPAADVIAAYQASGT